MSGCLTWGRWQERKFPGQHMNASTVLQDINKGQENIAAVCGCALILLCRAWPRLTAALLQDDTPTKPSPPAAIASRPEVRAECLW